MENTKIIYLYLKDRNSTFNFCSISKDLMEEFKKYNNVGIRSLLEKWASEDNLGSYCLNTYADIKALKNSIQKRLGKELLETEVLNHRYTYGLCRIWVTKHMREELKRIHKRNLDDKDTYDANIEPDRKFSLVLRALRDIPHDSYDRWELDEARDLCLSNLSAMEIVKKVFL